MAGELVGTGRGAQDGSAPQVGGMPNFRDLAGGIGQQFGNMFGRPWNPRGYDIDPNAFQDPNAEANKARYLAALEASQGRQGPQAQAAQVSPELRNRQMSYLDMLQAQAAGQGP